MTLLMDRVDGNESLNYAYHFRLTPDGVVQFLSKGTSGQLTMPVFSNLYVGRWYHLAVTRSSSSTFTAYVDGRQAAQATTNVGLSIGSGLSIGGVNGTTRPFYGDIIEAAIYPTNLVNPGVWMFTDQRFKPGIRGYYKLAYSTNTADNLRNFATNAASGTDARVIGSGVTFDEVDLAGEQSLFDSKINGGRDALAPLSGVFAWQHSLFSRPTPGIAFDFRIGFSSALPAPTTDPADDPYGPRSLGPGWRHSFETRVMPGGNAQQIKVITWDGAIDIWSRTNFTQPFRTVHGEYRGELKWLGDVFEVEWTTPEKLVYRFSNPMLPDRSDPDYLTQYLNAGRLLEVRDPHGNSLQVEWNWEQFRIDAVRDTSGGRWQFGYNADGMLSLVTFGGWQASLAYAGGRLFNHSITNTSGVNASASNTWHFYYNSSGHVNTHGLLDRIVDPNACTNVVVQYDRYRRKTRMADALNRPTIFDYGVPDSRTIRTTDPEHNPSFTTFDRKGRVLAETNALGQATSYTYNVTNGTRTSITEPLGWTTFFGFDSRGNMVARTNALGEVTRWAYHSNFNKIIAETNAVGWVTRFTISDVTGDVLAHNDDYGLILTNQYAPNGLLLAATDARGCTSRFLHDTNGFVIAAIDAGSNVTSYSYNELGWKLAETNALNQVTTWGYDLNGNVVRTIDPLLRVFTNSFDGNGNLLAESDAKERFTTYSYDAANQKTTMVDRTGTNQWRYFYSSRGNLTNTLNPLGFGSTNYYDAANRLVRVSCPLGNTISNDYDPNGNLVTMVDQLGRAWSKNYDRLNRVIEESDPQGNTKRTEYDILGRVWRITSPNGPASVNDYDNRGRLVRWTDPQGAVWQYAYDSGANITNITDALGGHYVMAYGPRNERILERNQDGKEWHYTYDTLLRLKQQIDPNGITRTLIYDAGGRIEEVRFSTGRVNSFAYDDNNNPEVLSRSGSGPATLSRLAYDVMDRVVQYTDAFNKTLKYEYDAVGRRAKLIYPGDKPLLYAYDGLSRLTSQTDWAGRQMVYEYDKAGRLVSRSYPNAVVQLNQYDDSGRITHWYCVSPDPSVSMAVNYAYDRNGNKTSVQESGTLDWPLPAFTDETARYTPSGRLIDKHIQSTASNHLSAVNYHYDASGNMTNAVGGGQSWALAYDEDNRTTSIAWDCGMTQKSITNRYDAIGRRIAKTVDGIQTGYVLDLSGGMERTLCDLAPDGAIAAYYIHGPDLSYKVTPRQTEAVMCYHADAQANIIGLTGQNGTNLAQYAYTPYGRSLAGTNTHPSTLNSQPFLFVGSQGVMEDLPGLLFMRARYYSDECGVFLSTDPVKNIGPWWRPKAYCYADDNPLRKFDPEGEFPWGIAYAALDALYVSLRYQDYGGATFSLFAGGSIDYAATVQWGEKVGGKFATAASLVLEAPNLYNGFKSASDPEQDDQFFANRGGHSLSGDLAYYLGRGIRNLGEMEKVKVEGAGPWANVGGQTKFSFVQAGDQANHLNDANSAQGSNGKNGGGSTVNPLRGEYRSKASRYRRQASQYSALAGEHFRAYQQARAAYSDLMANFSNTDYFNYFVMAQQSRQMADQAYAQYRNYDRQARSARDKAGRYWQLYRNSQ